MLAGMILSRVRQFYVAVLVPFLVSAVIPMGWSQGSGAGPVSGSTFASLSARAEAARDADRLDEAQSLYRKALILRPGWAEGWWSLGTIAYDRNSYGEADRAFQKLIVLAPSNGNAYVMMGLTEFELGRDSLALRHLDQGMRLGIDESANLRQVALYHRGILLQRAGKFQAAKETLEQLCMQGSQGEGVTRTLGMVLVRNGSREAPASATDDAIILEQIGRAGCLAGQKKFDEAKQELSATVRLHSAFPNIHYAFGTVLLEADDLAAAKAQFKEQIKDNPEDWVCRLQIAAAMYKTNSDEGLIYARQAVALAPREPFGHYLLGMLLLDTGDYQNAIPELEIAHKAFPQEGKIHIALGSAYSHLGKRQEASRVRAEFARLTEQEKKSSLGGGPGLESPHSEEVGVDSIHATPK
jgi:predicted Zn-dependent protease